MTKVCRRSLQDYCSRPWTPWTSHVVLPLLRRSRHFAFHVYVFQNALWFSFGWIVTLLIPNIILALWLGGLYARTSAKPPHEPNASTWFVYSHIHNGFLLFLFIYLGLLFSEINQ